MSSSSFEAFSERGRAVAGEDATRALHDVLQGLGRGARIAPERLAREMGLDNDELEDLLDVATDPAVGLLEDASQVRCPHCGARADLDPLLAQLEDEGEATCADCERAINDVGALAVEQRLRLSPDAAQEAAAWQAARAARPQLTAVILTALPEELAAVRAQLQAQGVAPATRTVASGGMYYEAQLEAQHVAWTVYATFTQATTGQAAAGAAEAVTEFSPALALYIGIAGGVKDVALGDVVAASDVFDYDGGKETEHGFLPRTTQLQSAFALNQLAGFTALEDRWHDRIVTAVSGLNLPAPQAHTEPIAAGSKVVASTTSETYKLVRRTADRAVAVEMEGSGFLGAIHRQRGVEGIVIRGISDLIDGKSAADRDGVRRQAVANAAAFAFELLDRFEPGRTGARGLKSGPAPR